MFGVGTNESVSDIFFEVFDFSDTNFSFKTSQFSTDLGAEGTEDLLKYFLNIIPRPKVTGAHMNHSTIFYLKVGWIVLSNG